ncbi:WhiB family transcriptional regulator [Streptomyces olindensis]|uniref:WhiB family transcriptional regulator n=1 Tax=Streptomyces olindensis TaxID=358823 RepID=UPI0036B4D168
MTNSYTSPETLPNRLAWAERAACTGYSLDLFFSEADLKVREAKQVCARCPVRGECLTEGLRAEDASRYGIYGGLTPEERTELVDAQARLLAEVRGQEPPKPRTGRKLAECGTRSAYQRHVRKGEPIDPACRAANTAADRQLRTTGSTKART